MKAKHQIGEVVTIEFVNGHRAQVTLTERHYNYIYGEWVYFALELGKNILESNIM